MLNEPRRDAMHLRDRAGVEAQAEAGEGDQQPLAARRVPEAGGGAAIPPRERPRAALYREGSPYAMNGMQHKWPKGA
jgi:hypothetical protein